MAQLTVFDFATVNTDELDVTSVVGGNVLAASASTYSVEVDGQVTTFSGAGLAYEGGLPMGGVVHAISDSYRGHAIYNLSGIETPADAFTGWAATGDNEALKRAVLAGGDVFTGGALSDLLRAYDGDDDIDGLSGDDTLDGGAGDDSLVGGAGHDQLIGGSGANMLRGDDGNDYLQGGDGFDDTHGNLGDDTVHGGGSTDWVVGGQGNDMLFGDSGDDLVYGNVGNDILDGDFGNDSLVGGQGDDLINGRSGDDWITGDRGNDTLTGDLGADTFRTFAQAGIDQVMDFSFVQGDRVQIDAGTAYTVAQVGADTVIDMGGGNRMILVGVDMASLGDGWII